MITLSFFPAITPIMACLNSSSFKLLKLTPLFYQIGIKQTIKSFEYTAVNHSELILYNI